MSTEESLYLILLIVLSGWLIVFYVRTRNSKTNQWFREVNAKRRARSGIYVYGYTDKEWEQYNGD